MKISCIRYPTKPIYNLPNLYLLGRYIIRISVGIYKGYSTVSGFIKDNSLNKYFSIKNAYLNNPSPNLYKI